MARNEAYLSAEKKIEEARQSGAKKLDLSVADDEKDNGELTELPESLSQLSQLEKLDLSGNRLTMLPESLSQLTQLQSLDLSSTQLATLPEWLGQFTQLRSLRLSRNQLKTLPELVGRLVQLQSLQVYDNKLTELPDWIGKLSALEYLHILGNKVTTLPSSIGHLIRLRYLDLRSNYLTELPALEKLALLESLYLSDNQLEVLPDWIGKLSKLQSLDLVKNRLQSLPDTLSNLTQLRKLAFSGNEFSVFPEVLCKITNLQDIYLEGNAIERIPDSIRNISNIRTLRLGGTRPSWLQSGGFPKGNRITDLPIVIADFRNLQELSLDANPLNPELAAASKEGLDAVKRYLRAKAEAQVVLNEAKLILIGEGEVGKSALLGALRGDDWVEERDTTHGIEIKPVKVIEPVTRIEITLNGWDFGGQRVYRPTHQLFFSAPAVYLVAWKPREGPQQGFVKEWIKLVKHREPEAKILVVATHGGPGARQPDIDRQEIWDLFGRDTVIDFFHVQSKPPRYDKEKKQWVGKCKGIKELKDAIAKIASSLPEVGRSVPKKWQEVREALKTSGEPYLPLEQVLAVCKSDKHKMSEEEAYDFIRISHRLGHLIHYGQDPALKDMVILKPDWLSTAMSFVLDDEETRKKHGLVKVSRLGRLWNDSSREAGFRYPAKVHPIFTALMQRFDLSYRVAGSPLGGQTDETHLIAQLVPDVRPQDDLVREWPDRPSANDEQQIQICRIVDARGNSSSAEGLFYQLIVRLHKFSLGREDFSKSIHWQRGLVIDDSYNGRALLEYIGNDVRITVRAAYPGYLLGFLTREVKWLVEDFWEGLRCEVVVPCIEPCGKKQPGAGVFEVQKLIAFKRQAMVLFPCTVSGCNQAQDIDCLLQNAPITRRPSIESLLAHGFAEMRTKLDELRLQNTKLDQQLSRMMSQVEDAFEGVMRGISDEGKEGPRLFSLHPVERSAFNPKGWVKKKFKVTLWCEHTRLPLTLINKNEDKGVYELEMTREWFAAAAPFLKVLAGTLSLVLPVAASATKLVMEEAAYKAIENQLDFGKECAEAMFGSSEKLAEWSAEKDSPEMERTGYIRAEGGALREFQNWLKKEDGSFGDLRRVLNKRQEFLWVHRNFEKEY